MSFSVSKPKPTKINPVILPLIQCADCGGGYAQEDENLTCVSCRAVKICDSFGVWDFMGKDEAHKVPAIFTEKEFSRWLDIFNTEESKNWVIYKNSFYRFFSQAGHRKMGKQLNKHLAASATILEIGAGTGVLLNFIPAHNYVAVDTSLEGLRILKARCPQATCIWTRASQLPFMPNAFANVVSLHTLEHLYYLAEALEEHIRVLQADGDMFFVIPTEGGWGFSMGRKLITGPHLRKKYKLDVDYVMDREHINTAARVMKFLRLYFDDVESRFWPLPFLKLIGPNAMIFGRCRSPRLKSLPDD